MYCTLFDVLRVEVLITVDLKDPIIMLTFNHSSYLIIGLAEVIFRNNIKEGQSHFLKFD